MPCHPDRVRRNGALPDDYQFGDAAKTCAHPGVVVVRLRDFRSLKGVTANVIEGEQHDDAWGDV